MENALKERATILENILDTLFKGSEEPSNILLKKISIHQILSNMPQRILSPESIKPDVNAILEKYAPQVDVMDEEVNFMCPLTQGKIQNPWKGVCGHVFEEKAILGFLKNGNEYCPIHGCDKKLAKKLK
jgi:hypothetical protein